MTIKLYWHRGAGRSDPNRQNFGDFLSPLIVEAVSKKKVEYAPLSHADMMAIGTILANEPKAKRFGFKRRVHIWGSGCGQEHESFSSRHYYHAVRGQETRARVEDGNALEAALGDPGLLCPGLISRPDKKWHVGFVPHYLDQQLPEAQMFIHGNPEVKFINVFQSPLDVLRDIASCEFVVSSSLHGLIVADAFGVPNIRARLSHGLIDELKFTDYYSAFGILPPELLEAGQLSSVWGKLEELHQAHSRPGLEALQLGLERSFPAIN